MVVQEAPVAVRITAQLEIITTPVKWVKWAFIPLQHPTIWGILITSKGTNSKLFYPELHKCQYYYTLLDQSVPLEL